MNMQPNKILQTPLLGPISREQLEKKLQESIIDEASAVAFYKQLYEEAPDKLYSDFIEHSYEDELRHLDYFTKLYFQLFGKEFEYEAEPVPYTNYREALFKALLGELKAIEYYRNVQLSVRDPLVRDVFYYAMVDEIEHSTQFATLLNLM